MKPTALWRPSSIIWPPPVKPALALGQTIIMDGRLTLAFTGDLMLGRGVNEAVRLNGPLWPWGDLLGPLKEADLRFVNLECVIARGGRPWERTPKTFLFKAEPAAVETLLAAGIDFAALANNHSLDFEEEGLLEMLERLDAAGIAKAGAGRDLAEASRPAFLDAPGVRIAVISITDNEPIWAAGPGRPGVNYWLVDMEPDNFARVEAMIKDARSGADLVVLSAHLGPNMVEELPPDFRRFARAAVDAGVDIFHGHSAHVFQGIEIYKGKVIIHDAGDFVDDYIVDPVLRNDLSFLFLVKVSGSGITEVELVPIQIRDYQVNLAEGALADHALSRMAVLCERLGTATSPVSGRLRIPVKSQRGRRAA